jgi:hypothetical protein
VSQPRRGTVLALLEKLREGRWTTESRAGELDSGLLINGLGLTRQSIVESLVRARLQYGIKVSKADWNLGA